MASMATFQPRGLIKTPIEQVLYHKAHIANVHIGIADPKEHETVALMTALLYSNVFTTRENFVVSNEQPPTPKSKQRCDIVVRYLETGSQNIRALCFAECKRTSTSQLFSLKALEEQAFEYCRLHLKHEGTPYVYAATMAGAHVRLWGCWQGTTQMEPFWGSWGAGDWSEYKDVGDDEDAQQIEAGFTRMKRFPPTPHAGHTSDTYGTLPQSGMLSHTTAIGYQAAPSGFQAAQSGHQSGPYTVSYSAKSAASSGTPGGQYKYPIPGTETKLGAQMNEADGDGQYDKEGEDDGEDYQMDGGTGNQYTAPSSAGSKYTVVRVTKIPHTFGSDEFIFIDSKGRPRSTKREDWKRIKYNGELAWKNSHYICRENPFW